MSDVICAKRLVCQKAQFKTLKELELSHIILIQQTKEIVDVHREHRKRSTYAPVWLYTVIRLSKTSFYTQDSPAVLKRFSDN